MSVSQRICDALADARLDANLLVFYGLAVVMVVLCLIVRRMLARGGNQISAWAGKHWLGTLGEEATRRARAYLAWLTLGTVLIITVGGTAYHFSGGDIRAHLSRLARRVWVADPVTMGGRCLGVVAVLAACLCGVRLVRRLRPYLEAQVASLVGHAQNEEQLQIWFALFQRYLVIGIRLAAVWGIGHVVGLPRLSDHVVGFILRVLAILAGARLATLGSRALSHTTAEYGDRHLAQGKYARYWERIKHLFPFGQRCLEATVYVLAASLCVAELSFISSMEVFGPMIVACIGILFGTRVLIELSHVLLHEAFGLYTDEELIDQKARTLVPLLQSVCQYVLYFGAGILMLSVFGLSPMPVLAGAGIVGLGVGLGAQSLVTDVVSGFFILFEGQYLVGDFVQIGDATGIVEAVGIRVTEVRDGQGKLYIIPNGQIKQVVNYSKGYINAVVDVRLAAGADLEVIFRVMAEAGRRLRQAHKEVLAATEIHGLVEMGTSEMTVRAVTRVQPGKHTAMQNEYRRLLKQLLDQKDTPQEPRLLAA